MQFFCHSICRSSLPFFWFIPGLLAFLFLIHELALSPKNYKTLDLISSFLIKYTFETNPFLFVVLKYTYFSFTNELLGLFHFGEKINPHIFDLVLLVLVCFPQ